MKIINNWLFTNQLWVDAQPSPIAINMNNVYYIGEHYDSKIGAHVSISTNNNGNIIVEGNIDDVLTEFHNYLLTH